jgi:hypothetical protein
MGPSITLHLDRVSPARSADLIEPWIPNQYPHAKAALKSGIDLSIAFFASFCGDRVTLNAWNGYKIGTCLTDFTRHFQRVEPVVDFMFGNVNPLVDRVNLASLAGHFPEVVQSWIAGHHHPLFPTSAILDFSKNLGIAPPYDFVNLTAWIPKLNSDSTPTGFSPSFFFDLSLVIQNWVFDTVTATANETCASSDWQNCTFTGKYDPLDRLFSDDYGTLVQQKTIGLVDKVALYTSLSGFLMQKLDTEHVGYLSDDIKNLITIVISLLDTTSYAQNVVNQVLEKPYSVSDTEDSLKSIQKQGLSELAAFAANVIPNRDQDTKNFIQRIQKEVLTPDKSDYTLDQLGITAFIYLYDLIENMRGDYLAHYPIPVRVDGPTDYIQRRDFVESLPSILHDHFPSIYDQCVQWGFEKTCGVVFTEVLPGGDDKTGEIETYEVDVVTLTSVLLESMMNRCDVDHDGKLSANLIKGVDEKQCMVEASTALAQRLMRANIVGDNNTAETWINLVKGISFVRWAAEGAISRGTLQGIAWKALPPASLFSGPATLGSVLSLAAEFMSPDKTKAIAANTVGPSRGPGDELLYHHELTDHFLANDTKSLRH